MSELNVTILIPTFNRPNELRRCLKFLSLLKNPFKIIVLDGSDVINRELNKQNAHFFNTLHLSFPENTHLSTRFSEALNKHVITKYTLICPDDDFVIPETIVKASKILEADPELSSVNGAVKCLAYPKKFSSLGFFSFLADLDNPLNLDADTFIERYFKHNAIYETGCPPLFYALRRTEQAKCIFNMIDSSFKYSSMEVLNDILTLVWGKSITIPDLLMIRNYSSETIRESIREDPISGMTTENVIRIRSILNNELKKSVTSDEIINYIIDLTVKLPLKKNSDKYTTDSLKTNFSKWIAYKINWINYFLNYLFPFFPEKLDRSLQKKILIALRKSF